MDEREDDDASPALDGTWLVVSSGPDDDTLAARVRAAIEAHGGTALPCAVPRDGDVCATLGETLRQATESHDRLRGVLAFVPDEAGTSSAPASLARFLAIVQAHGDAPANAPLWFVTECGVAVRAGEAVSPAVASAWALGRVAALEAPARWGGLIDIARSDDGIARPLAAALEAKNGEDQVAVRDGGRFVRRLVRPASPDAVDGAFVTSGTALVTGGTGALGGHVAKWLVDHGTRHVVLASRRAGDASGADALRTELEAKGATVAFAACDAGDPDAIAALLARIDGEGPSCARSCTPPA